MIPLGSSHEHLVPWCRASLCDYAHQCCHELLHVAETQMLAEPPLVGREQALRYRDSTKGGLISASDLPVHSGRRCQCKRAVLSADIKVLLEQEGWVPLSTPALLLPRGMCMQDWSVLGAS